MGHDIDYVWEPGLGGWDVRHLPLADEMLDHGVDLAAYSRGGTSREYLTARQGCVLMGVMAENTPETDIEPQIIVRMRQPGNAVDGLFIERSRKHYPSMASYNKARAAGKPVPLSHIERTWFCVRDITAWANGVYLVIAERVRRTPDGGMCWTGATRVFSRYDIENSCVLVTKDQVGAKR